MTSRPSHIGAHVARVEDDRLLSGGARFVADVSLPGMLDAAFYRSPLPHALIETVDTGEAMELPGVAGVFTADDMTDVSPFPDFHENARPVAIFPLARGKVRYVGAPLAVVVAPDRYQAEDARDLLAVDLEPLDPVVSVDEALAADAPLLYPEWPDNIVIESAVANPEATAEFEGRMTVSGRYEIGRHTGVPMETRGVAAEYRDGRLTVWTSTQFPHIARTMLSYCLPLDETDIRVIAPDVGGGFGVKAEFYVEEVTIPWLAMRLGRPVRWIEDRREHLIAACHARDLTLDLEVAVDGDGRFRAVRGMAIQDLGSAEMYPYGFSPAFAAVSQITGPYRIPQQSVGIIAVATNKTPCGAYRGFGKDSATFLMERIIDRVSRETGIDRATVRYRNFIQPDEFPYSQPSGAMLDSGNYPGSLDKVLEMIGWDGFPDMQQQAREEGRYIGIGLSQELTPEGCAMPGAVLISAYDGATVRVAPSGDVTVLTGVTSPGCGNETAMAQIAAEFLGCEMERIKVLQGDTESCPYGLGNFSSRATMYGGSAVQAAATELREKMFRIAGRMLEAAPEDLDAAHGRIFVLGAESRSVGFDEVANQVYRHTFGEYADEEEPGLESPRYFRMGNVYHQPEKQGRFSNYPAWPSGTAACIVEVDPDTGGVQVLRFCLVDDAGTVINPLLVTANLHGSIAQGIGGTMYEQLSYDSNGQLLTATLMDYTIPTAVELPRFEVEHQETPSPFTPLGMKGVGESGVGACLNALCSAIENALPELDLEINELILSPGRVWNAINEARLRQGVTL